MSHDHDTHENLNSQMSKEPGIRPTRRRLLTTGVLVGTSAVSFAVGRNLADSNQSETVSHVAAGPERVSPLGPRQPGITSPSPRQQNATVSIFDVLTLAQVPEMLDELGNIAVDAIEGGMLADTEPARLTLTVGVGPRVIREFLSEASPGSQMLPNFQREQFDSPGLKQGDLFIQLCADDQMVTSLVQARVEDYLADKSVKNWSAQGFRGALDQGTARNLLGFHDGLSVPRGDAELDDLVWFQEPERLRGATIAVVRRMPIDVARFAALTLEEQEQAVGRRRKNGAPLSGGSREDDPNLHSKSPAGEVDIPLGAHVRRAHPLPSGVKGLMLRRGYSYFNSSDDQGLLFISFQSELRTFTATQHRMDELDALMNFTKTTASGTFLIGPGQTADTKLGDFLRSSAP